jgi:hypothetical protein
LKLQTEAAKAWLLNVLVYENMACFSAYFGRYAKSQFDVCNIVLFRYNQLRATNLKLSGFEYVVFLRLQAVGARFVPATIELWAKADPIHQTPFLVTKDMP